MNNQIDRILKIREVMEITGKRRTSIYGDMKKGTFPSSVSIGQKAVGWKLSDIQKWLENL